MSGQWAKKRAETAASNKVCSQSPEPVSAVRPPSLAPRKHLAGAKLPPEKWNFNEIQDDELWAALIWEYGCSASWIHHQLPPHDISDDAERAKQIGRFYAEERSTALKLLNDMRLWQWRWSQTSGVQNVDFFSQDTSWKSLPPVVRANMCRAVAGLEPAADLVRLGDILADASPEDGSKSLKAVKIMEQLAILQPPPLTPEEQTLLNEPQAWLPGGNGLDDVTAAVIKLETQFLSLRKTLDRLLRGEISPTLAQEQLQHASWNEISLSRFQNDPTLRDGGYFAVAFRGNFKLKREELITKFGQWLDDAWPKKFLMTRKGKRSTTRGPKGLVLKKADGKFVEPATALKQLGTWRILKAAGSPKNAIACYWPVVSGKARAAKDVELSRDSKAVEEFFKQLFPHSQS